jgi:two-component system response regulator HydG
VFLLVVNRTSDCLTVRGAVKTSILVVDDESSIVDSLVAILNENGFDAVGANNGLDAVDKVSGNCPKILLTDIAMPKMDGLQLAIKVRQKCPSTRILLISGQSATVDYLEQAKAQGHNFEFLPKPIEPDDLLERLQA